MKTEHKSHVQKTREAHFDDPWVTNDDYGSMIEQATEDDEAEELRAEREQYKHDEDEEDGGW